VRELVRGGHVFSEFPRQLTDGAIMKDSIVSASYIIGLFLLVGLLFDGCMISSAIHDVATNIQFHH